ncbi:MAG TPA: GFA family protein [Sulfuricaulis sp.]|nr:GFA family protein [Sulfuricaulis sp.]
MKGEERVRSFKIPEAKRFTSRFCSVCGSQVPRYVKETDMIVIPAGSLDGDPMMQPQACAFWDSRASWSCGGDDIPVHSEYATS